jgi:glyoxylate/hydroxypyruvate reductase A
MTILLATNFEPAEQAQWLALLRAELPDEALVTETPPDGAAAIDVAIVANPRPGALRGLPRLVLIQSLWAGVERLLADPDIPAGVPLARMVDPAMNEAMAQTALWAVLALQRDFFDYAAQQRERRWLQHPQRRADEVAVAVLGLGQMGRAVAARLAANGYRVSGWSTGPAELPEVHTCHGDAALAELLGACDVVINLLPLTAATRGLFDARCFARMRRGASFVNLARGAHVVEADLIDALDRGPLHRAVLDVFHAEPLPADHPFWAHPRITVLPHTAAQTDARSAAAIAARNVHALRAGRPVTNFVDRTRGY